MPRVRLGGRCRGAGALGESTRGTSADPAHPAAPAERRSSNKCSTTPVGHGYSWRPDVTFLMTFQGSGHRLGLCTWPPGEPPSRASAAATSLPGDFHLPVMVTACPLVWGLVSRAVALPTLPGKDLHPPTNREPVPRPAPSHYLRCHLSTEAHYVGFYIERPQ